MYYIIENWKITDSSESYLFSKHWTTIEKSFTQEELEKINARYSYNIETSEFEETEESREFEKREAIKRFKEIEKIATQKRTEYITAELLPEWEYKELKLAKLFREWEEIKLQYEAKNNELKIKYWDDILLELI